MTEAKPRDAGGHLDQRALGRRASDSGRLASARESPGRRDTAPPSVRGAGEPGPVKPECLGGRSPTAPRKRHRPVAARSLVCHRPGQGGGGPGFSTQPRAPRAARVSRHPGRVAEPGGARGGGCGGASGGRQRAAGPARSREGRSVAAGAEPSRRAAEPRAAGGRGARCRSGWGARAPALLTRPSARGGGPRRRAPDGAVLSLPRRVRGSVAEPGRKKSKAGRGCRKKTEGGCISGHFGCSVCGRKEKEKGKNRKTNCYIWTPTRRWT